MRDQALPPVAAAVDLDRYPIGRLGRRRPRRSLGIAARSSPAPAHVLLRDCECGGAFEYVPQIRSAEAENYDRVQRLLEGDRSEVVRLDMAPGTLALFMGRHSIHRVTPIAGETLRLIALLGYDTKPGTMSSERLKNNRYGRTAPIVPA